MWNYKFTWLCQIQHNTEKQTGNQFLLVGQENTMWCFFKSILLPDIFPLNFQKIRDLVYSEYFCFVYVLVVAVIQKCLLFSLLKSEIVSLAKLKQVVRQYVDGTLYFYWHFFNEKNTALSYWCRWGHTKFWCHVFLLM